MEEYTSINDDRDNSRFPWSPPPYLSHHVLACSKLYKYEPKEDITIYELAVVTPIIAHPHGNNVAAHIDRLPDNAKRHFVEIGDRGPTQ